MSGSARVALLSMFLCLSCECLDATATELCEEPLAPASPSVLSFSVFSKRNSKSCQWESEVVLGEGGADPLLNGGWVVKVNQSAQDPRSNRQVIEVIASTTAKGITGSSKAACHKKEDEKDFTGITPGKVNVEITDTEKDAEVTSVENDDKVAQVSEPATIIVTGEGNVDGSTKIVIDPQAKVNGTEVDTSDKAEGNIFGGIKVDNNEENVKGFQTTDESKVYIPADKEMNITKDIDDKEVTVAIVDTKVKIPVDKEVNITEDSGDKIEVNATSTVEPNLEITVEKQDNITKGIGDKSNVNVQASTVEPKVEITVENQDNITKDIGDKSDVNVLTSTVEPKVEITIEKQDNITKDIGDKSDVNVLASTVEPNLEITVEKQINVTEDFGDKREVYGNQVKDSDKAEVDKSTKVDTSDKTKENVDGDIKIESSDKGVGEVITNGTVVEEKEKETITGSEENEKKGEQLESGLEGGESPDDTGFGDIIEVDDIDEIVRDIEYGKKGYSCKEDSTLKSLDNEDRNEQCTIEENKQNLDLDLRIGKS